MSQIENAIKLVTDYIVERGLEIKEVVMPTEDNAFVRVWTTEAKIRSIDLKSFMEYSGIAEYRIGYDAVDFIPEADIKVWNGEILTEDPFLKADQVKESLLKEFEGVIEPSELVVEQKRGPKVAEGTNNFTFTVTTNEVSGQLSEKMYIDKMIPVTSMATLVGDMLKDDNRKTFGPEDVKAQLMEASPYQLQALKEDLTKAAETAGKFGAEHAKGIYARLAMIDEVLALKPQPVYEDDYEDEDEDEDFMEVEDHVGIVIGSVNLDRNALEELSVSELEEIEMHLNRAKESAGCLPILRDSINNCLALIKEIKDEA